MRELEGGIRLPDPLDLHISKADTGREHDLMDQLFLESIVKTRFEERLPVCDLAEARSLTDRFLDPGVSALVLSYPREFKAEGDPYSRDRFARHPGNRKRDPDTVGGKGGRSG